MINSLQLKLDEEKKAREKLEKEIEAIKAISSEISSKLKSSR
jgi:signal transduction histidine kinase